MRTVTTCSVDYFISCQHAAINNTHTRPMHREGRIGGRAHVRAGSWPEVRPRTRHLFCRTLRRNTHHTGGLLSAATHLLRLAVYCGGVHGHRDGRQRPVRTFVPAMHMQGPSQVWLPGGAARPRQRPDLAARAEGSGSHPRCEFGAPVPCGAPLSPLPVCACSPAPLLPCYRRWRWPAPVCPLLRKFAHAPVPVPPLLGMCSLLGPFWGHSHALWLRQRHCVWGALARGAMVP